MLYLLPLACMTFTHPQIPNKILSSNRKRNLLFDYIFNGKSDAREGEEEINTRRN